jgi:hypothetical protein
VAYNSYQLLTKLCNIFLLRISQYINENFGVISVSFNVTDQLLIRISAFVTYLRRNGSMRQYISYS